MNNKAFSLIELMIAVMVIGILTAIAIPNYRNYITKSQIANAFNVLEGLKEEVMNNYHSQGLFAPELAATEARATAVSLGIVTFTYIYNINVAAAATYYCKPNNFIGSVNVALVQPGIGINADYSYLALLASSDGEFIKWQCQTIYSSFASSLKPEFLPAGCVKADDLCP